MVKLIFVTIHLPLIYSRNEIVLIQLRSQYIRSDIVTWIQIGKHEFTHCMNANYSWWGGTEGLTFLFANRAISVNFNTCASNAIFTR